MTDPSVVVPPPPLSALSLICKPPLDDIQALMSVHSPNRLYEISVYPKEGHEEEELNYNYRYQLLVYDRKIKTTTTTNGGGVVRNDDDDDDVPLLRYATAVFIIPAGREAEFMFISKQGLRALAESAQTARLVAVRLGRKHTFHNNNNNNQEKDSFSGIQFIQHELTDIVQLIAQHGRFLSFTLSSMLSSSSSSSQGSSIPTPRELPPSVMTEQIPFMALDGIGHRDVLAEGDTHCSGRYLVEQVIETIATTTTTTSSGDGAGQRQQLTRRLYFMDNPFLIQSEVRLVMMESPRPVAKADNPPSSTLAEPGPVATSPPAPPQQQNWMVDKSQVAFEYHKSIVEGILALSSSTSASSPPPPPPLERGLLIGLGGGGLVNYMQYVATDLHMVIVELDPVMVHIARTYFGLDDKACDSVLIGDGLLIDTIPPDAEQEDSPQDESRGVSPLTFAPGHFQVIIIDVDSKNREVGMSCPPELFVEPTYLLRLSNLLTPDGVLSVNVAARDPTLFQAVCDKVASVFPSVFLIRNNHDDDDDHDDAEGEDDAKEDINVVLFGCNKSIQLDYLGTSIFDPVDVGRASS